MTAQIVYPRIEGLADPSAASTERAPATSAVAYRLSMANRLPQRQRRGRVCVPIEKRKTFLGRPSVTVRGRTF
jgi:hypothetical protein